jgi:hypothetical protein
VKRLALVAILAFTATVSCQVNEYCLNCANGDGGTGDGGDGDAIDAFDGDGGDGGDGGQCIPTGVEVCDNKDNDCNGMIDDGVLPEVDQPCAEQRGECAGGVKQCVNGAIKCSKVPAPEVCDLKDNDCNGMTDEGDPGGGARCGTELGECQAGTLHCNRLTGIVECQGAVGGITPPFGTAEVCDGKDNDCDGSFDEGIGGLGSCGGAPGNVGECHTGTLMCVGGGTACIGDQGPTFEACDTLDNDCDGTADEDTNKNTDPQNCGSCNHVCILPHAFEGCAGGNCTVAACEAGFHDNNNQAVDGCEFGPCTIQGNEVCNGIDDNCNGQTDEGVAIPPNFCLTAGACAGAGATCQGVDGFRCNYNGNVSQDANGNVIPETLCDGIDNDCDGRIDEGQPNLGQACSDTGVGTCKGTGTFQCDPAALNGPAICVITTPGSSSPESCDGKDNDCDGVIDNGANTGNLPGQDWVTIPGNTVRIMKWEASRPDATATGVGTNQVFACSKQNVQPWTNVTYPQALAACNSIGARLCSETEWQSMCQQEPVVTYPVSGPTGASDHVFIEAEQAFANVSKNVTSGSGTGVHSWTNDTTQNFSGVRDLIATPNTGADVSVANATLQAARLDFQINFTQTGNHFVWIRVLGATANDTGVYAGINATAGNTVLNATLAPNQLQIWQWVVSPATNITVTGNQFVSVFMRRDGVRVDAISVSKDGVNPPPVDEKTWAYQSNPKFAQAQVCNDDEFDTSGTAGDQDDILATGSRPACFANGPAGADVFDMSGNVKEWTLARAAGQNPLRGGASNNTVNGLTCQLNFTLADDAFFFPNVGFRCCR